MFIYARKKKRNYIEVLDRVVVIVPLAGAFVRIGNLMNSEIVGKVANVPWAFYFPRNDCPPPFDCDLSTIAPRHPSQLYEAIFYLALFGVMYFLYKKQFAKKAHGYLLGIFMILLFAFRFVVEYLKDVQVDFESTMALNMGQWLSIPFVLVGIFLLLRSLKVSK